MIIQIPGFPIPLILPRRPDEEPEKFPYEREEARRLYENYRSFLGTFLSRHNLHESSGQTNEDPWSPGFHYLCRQEGRRILGLISYTQSVAVAEIVGEPIFAERDIDILNMSHDGLEIRVIDQNVKPIIEKLCQQYNQQFDEQSKIV